MASLSWTHIGVTNNSVAEFVRNRCRPISARVGLRVTAETGREPDLSVTVNGLQMPNPFVIGSGPPGTNYTVMKRAFDEGWGAVIAKTASSFLAVDVDVFVYDVSLDATKVINVTPRYARLRAGSNGSAKGQIIGWENIELISDRPLETMLKEFKQLKAEYPDRILIASIMEEYNKAAWEELIDRVEQTGIDAIEVNFSCPHGTGVMNIAKMMKSEYGDKEDLSLSGIGGVETGGDAAEFLLLGASTVQVCTGVMMHGYGLVKKLCAELKDFMRMHNFSSIEDFRGVSLEYFTTHMDLVRRQQEAIKQRKAIKKGLQSDKDWTGDGFVNETESMV
ncbi:hypothetical protein SAY87_006544 [Trapa incisa]|uniref:dihydropyrimidine dehydrogenase (NADP(+)) n=1 Tax=Trapa incisa TaxID=236973 RepID=A0AAN7JZW1_9MYRT|nr:hypothetical protein SAY87_006544 [Trapa incisa]